MAGTRGSVTTLTFPSPSSPPESSLDAAGIRYSVRHFTQTYAELTSRSFADGTLGRRVMESGLARCSLLLKYPALHSAYPSPSASRVCLGEATSWKKGYWNRE